MGIHQNLRFDENAPVSQRIAAASHLARSLLASDLSTQQRMAIDATVTMMLDDRSPKVRAAIAEILSTSYYAPVHIVSALAFDQPEVSGFVLVRSPLLSDAELIDRVALGGEVVQCLVASRAKLSYAVSAAVGEVAEASACADLVNNSGAVIAAVTFRRIAERFGCESQVRNALLAHKALPADCRHLLVVKLGEVLSAMQLVRAAIGDVRAGAVTRDACMKASLCIAEVCEADELPALVEHLRLRGDITTGFVIRTVAAGRIDFFAAILVALSGMQERRVLSILNDGREAALCALLRQAGLSANTHRPLTAAISAWRQVANGQIDVGPQIISKIMYDISVDGSGGGMHADNDDLASLLRSIHLEATRDNARLVVNEYTMAIEAA